MSISILKKYMDICKILKVEPSFEGLREISKILE
jgi:hypothetical protein